MKRFFVGISALSALWIACDDGPQSHVYVAMLYEPAAACLDPSTTLQIIDTPNGSLLCSPTCLVETPVPNVGGTRTYVSTMCGPYPDNFDTSGTDPSCAGALAAYAAGAVCGESTEDAGTAEDSGMIRSGDASDGASSSTDAGNAGDATDASSSGGDAGDASSEAGVL